MGDFNLAAVRVTAATPKVVLGNPIANINVIRDMVSINERTDVFVFPELSITGYTCADMFRGYLVDEAMEAVSLLAAQLRDVNAVVIVGVPVKCQNMLFNCAAVLNRGQIVGIVPKSYIPNYNEFYEARWFSAAHKAANIKEVSYAGRKIPFGTDLIFDNGAGAKIGVEICEDLWVPIPPSTYAALAGANILVNLSASNETIGKKEYRRNLVLVQSAKTISAYVYSSAGQEESSTDLVFSGHSLISVNGKVVAENIYPTENHTESVSVDIEALSNDRRRMTTYMPEETQKEFRYIPVKTHHQYRLLQGESENVANPYPFVPTGKENVQKRCMEITDIQANGLATRLRHSHINKMVIGISGGLDSTLALLVAVKACEINHIPVSNIHCVTMPGFGTTERTKGNAEKLVELLGCKLQTIDIRKEATIHMEMMGRTPEYQGADDVTFENVQARIRTLYLMNLANQEGALVIGTGDLSELALGWCTYNGDHMSMYAVNVGIPKTLVKYLILNYSEIYPKLTEVLHDICDTPISPELVPTENGEMVQKTEDSIGKYDLHDFFLYNFVRNGFSPEKIYWLAIQAFTDKTDSETIKNTLNTFLARFASQQFKRSCLPDGPKVGSVALSPRGDWRMPSDNIYIPRVYM